MVAAPPVRLYSLEDLAGPPGVTVGFAVARGIRGAVLRNRIKRILREAYRLQKEPLIQALAGSSRSVRCVLMFTGPSPRHPGLLRLQAVQEPVGQVLARLARTMGKHV
jgi:ribonuclease P protein component